jgi:hypothetical protein
MDGYFLWLVVDALRVSLRRGDYAEAWLFACGRLTGSPDTCPAAR